MTSPLTSPHLAPRSGVEPPERLRPSPLPLRGGAKSEGRPKARTTTTPRPTKKGEVETDREAPLVIILELGPPPAKPLSLNEERRLHWRARCARTDPWRDLTILMARQARLARAVLATPATVTIVIPVPDDRRRDPSNYLPVAKACIDGLVKADVWPDDDPRYVRVNEPILTRDPNASIRIELAGGGTQ